MARPLRGWGDKDWAIKEKITFFILLPFKNKHYFTLDNLSKYGHIMLKFVGRYFYSVVTIFSKKQGKISWEKKSSQNPFSAILSSDGH